MELNIDMNPEEKKDLIIGYASKYTWDDLKCWINSIKKTDFSGDIILVSDNITKETIQELNYRSINLSLYGKSDDRGDFVSEQNLAPHVNRFFYIWNTLKSLKKDYRFVITTDTRDVIFQKNPSIWLENNMVMHNLVASSESLKYKDEPWGNNNLLSTFGPFYHNILKNEYIYNVGVIAGDMSHVTGMMSLIFQLSLNRPIPIVDQAVYNFILRTEPYDQDTYFSSNIDNWAVNLGTAIQAVSAGSGDLGQAYIQNEDVRNSYLKAYDDHQVTFENDLVMGLDNLSYTIVHQYDRAPELKLKIQKLYGELNASESRSIFHHPV